MGSTTPNADAMPKSFFISRRFSPPEIDTLKSYRLVPVAGTGREFFEIITKALGKFPTANEVILKTNPDLGGMLKLRSSSISLSQKKCLEDFYGTFEPVKQRPAEEQ